MGLKQGLGMRRAGTLGVKVHGVKAGFRDVVCWDFRASSYEYKDISRIPCSLRVKTLDYQMEGQQF